MVPDIEVFNIFVSASGLFGQEITGIIAAYGFVSLWAHSLYTISNLVVGEINPTGVRNDW